MSGATRPVAPDEDLYAILGVACDASSDAIRQAYRLRARSCHPDVTRSPRAAERFRRLAAAYEVLGHDASRRTYDRQRTLAAMRTAAVSPGPSATHRAPGPTWNPAVRGPAAQAARARPGTRGPEAPRPERTSADEWRLASVLGRVVAAAALVLLLGIGALALAAAANDPDPVPGPTMLCRTPDGWMDCRRAIDPSYP